MTEVRLYYVPHNKPQEVLTQILERAVKRGWGVVVCVQSVEEMKRLDKYLWTYDPTSFLVHGCASEDDPSQYPIWLSTEVSNTNGAKILILLTKAIPTDTLDSYEMICVLTDEDMSEEWRKRTKYRITRHKQLKSGQWKAY